MNQTMRRMLREHSQLGSIEHRLRFLVVGMAGEAGEALNLIKKDWRGDAGDRSAALLRELADTANYAFMAAAEMGADLEEHMLSALLEFERRPGYQELVEKGGDS